MLVQAQVNRCLSEIQTENISPYNLKFTEIIRIKYFQVQLEENGVKLSLTVVDTPGYGDNVDNSDCWEEVIDNSNY